MHRGLVLFAVLAGCGGQQVSTLEADFPLAVDDPRAQLDPAWANAEPEPEQSGPFDAVTVRSDVALFHDLRTGATSVLEERTAAAPESLPFEAALDPQQPGVTRQGLRTNVTNTTAYPARTTVKLYSTYSNGQRFVCSGAMIGRRYVLTAAHCVFNSGRGGWATEVVAAPGQSGAYLPYGTATSIGLSSVTAYTEDGSKSSDFAMVTLDADLGNSTGWLGLSSAEPSGNLVMNGYPAETYNGSTQVTVTGSDESVTSDMVYYTLESEGGFSGSAVRRAARTDYAGAINTRSNCYGFPFTWSRACGVRLNSSRVNRLIGWMAN